MRLFKAFNNWVEFGVYDIELYSTVYRTLIFELVMVLTDGKVTIRLGLHFSTYIKCECIIAIVTDIYTI